MPGRTCAARRRGGSAISLVAALLLATGCGARWSDEQRAELAARTQGVVDSGGALGPGVTPGETSDGSTPTGGATATTTGAGGVAAGGPSTGGGPAAGGSKPCAAPSNAPGVTDDKITVASLSSLSGPVPGIGSSAAAATRAYVAYRNATGGVCGRQIVLREADDGTDNGRYRSTVSELAPQVFGIAGGFAIGDVGGIDVLRSTRIPVVTVPSASRVTEVPTVFDINPDYDDLDAVIGKYRYLRENGASEVSMVYIAVEQSRAEALKQRSLMEAAGLHIAQVQELPLSTLSYDSAARGVANSGADYLFFIGPTDGNAAMAKAMADTGYELEFAEYFAYGYATEFVDLAGDAAEGAMTWMRTRPNEDASKNAEVAAFVQWMDRVTPGADQDPFAADAWAGTKAFFDTLESLPGPISRDAFVSALRGVKTYDAGGMLGPIRLGAKRTNGCFVGMHVVDGEWERLVPREGFLC